MEDKVEEKPNLEKDVKSRCMICKKFIKNLVYVGQYRICNKCFTEAYERAKKKREKNENYEESDLNDSKRRD